jgi:gas vesicle protein
MQAQEGDLFNRRRAVLRRKQRTKEMVMETDNKFSFFFLGLGLGTAIGLLFAPKSGAGTRNYLLSKTKDGTSYLKNQGEQLINNATETVERGKQTLETQVKNFTDALDAGKHAYREAVKPPSATV